jgi:hypothetical protein
MVILFVYGIPVLAMLGREKAYSRLGCRCKVLSISSDQGVQNRNSFEVCSIGNFGLIRTPYNEAVLSSYKNTTLDTEAPR